MPRFQVYVAAPIGARTGGPEALHQLVDALRKSGVDAALWPIGRSRLKETVSDYSIYDCPIASDWPLGSATDIVVPEVSPKELFLAPNTRKWLWWLSVTNSSHPAAQAEASRLLPRENLPRTAGANIGRRLRDTSQTRLSSWGSRKSGFLFQSVYAQRFAEQHLHRTGYMVTDYLRVVDFPLWSAPVRPTVAFNGAKGARMIEELKPLLPDVTFQPIEGMPYLRVLETLAGASMYLEVGHLPGRDRLPREAARVGCPVMVLKRGAGAFHGDFPLPETFRIPVGSDWVPRAAKGVNHVLSDPGNAVSSQREFQVWVHSDRSTFQNEVDSWWRACNGEEAFR